METLLTIIGVAAIVALGFWFARRGKKEKINPNNTGGGGGKTPPEAF